MLPSSLRSQIFSPSRYTSNRPFAPGVREIPTSVPKCLKNSLATHVAVARCCQPTQYVISTNTFHSGFAEAISVLLRTSYLPTLPVDNAVNLRAILHIPPRKSSGRIPYRRRERTHRAHSTPYSRRPSGTLPGEPGCRERVESAGLRGVRGSSTWLILRALVDDLAVIHA